MSDNTTEQGIGMPNREDYWQGYIKNKSPEEVASIIANFEQRATRDNLTGLINKGEFQEEFGDFSTGAFRRNADVYVLFLDFDDLKKVNDNQGHDAGNELLKKGSQLLKSSLRSNDLLCRLQGDEFAAALEIKKPDGAQEEPERLIQRIVSNLAVEDVSVSIGMCKFGIGDNLNEALAKAERNMKLDKTDRKAGRDFVK